MKVAFRRKMRQVQLNFLSRKNVSFIASFLPAGMIAAIAFVKSDSLIESLKNINVYWTVAGLGCYWGLETPFF